MLSPHPALYPLAGRGGVSPPGRGNPAPREMVGSAHPTLTLGGGDLK